MRCTQFTVRSSKVVSFEKEREREREREKWKKKDYKVEGNQVGFRYKHLQNRRVQ